MVFYFLVKGPIHNHFEIATEVMDLDRGKELRISLPRWMWDWCRAIATHDRVSLAEYIADIDRRNDQFRSLAMEDVIAFEIKANLRYQERHFWGPANQNRQKRHKDGMSALHRYCGSPDRAAANYLAMRRNERGIARVLGRALGPARISDVFPDAHTIWLKGFRHMIATGEKKPVPSLEPISLGSFRFSFQKS